MALGITADDFTQTLTDLKVSVTYRASVSTLDEFGGTSYSFSADTTKTWIFFKRNSRTDLIKWGISEVGDAYVLMPVTDSISFGDRLVYDSEVFEYTPDCINAYRYANNTAMYRYYTLRKVGTE